MPMIEKSVLFKAVLDDSYVQQRGPDVLGYLQVALSEVIDLMCDLASEDTDPCYVSLLKVANGFVCSIGCEERDVSDDDDTDDEGIDISNCIFYTFSLEDIKDEVQGRLMINKNLEAEELGLFMDALTISEESNVFTY